jgi:hypothetical protein
MKIKMLIIIVSIAVMLTVCGVIAPTDMPEAMQTEVAGCNHSCDTPTATARKTATNTPADTATRENTPTNTLQDTPTNTPTLADTPTNTPQNTSTDTPTLTPTRTATLTNTFVMTTPWIQDTPTNTPTISTPEHTPWSTPTPTENICVPWDSGRDVVQMEDLGTTRQHFGYYDERGIFIGVCKFEVPSGMTPAIQLVIKYCECGLPADYVFHAERIKRWSIYNNCDGTQALYAEDEVYLPFGNWAFGSYCPSNECE